MKKSLIALAAMAAAGVASAQSSVTLFGILDVGYNRLSASGAGTLSRLASDRYNSSRLGFRGTEDLGGGMSASFWFEAGVNVDTGGGSTTTANNTSTGQTASVGVGSNATYAPANQYSAGGTQGLTFNRRSTVSLAGAFGEVRLGRDYTPQFWNLTVFDPFGTNGVGSALNLAYGTLLPAGRAAVSPPGNPTPQVRSSNSVGYFLPANLGGFYGQVQYAFSEVPSSCTGMQTTTGAAGNVCPAEDGNGRHLGARLGFASGPFNVAGSIGRTRYGSVQTANSNTTLTTFAGDYDAWNIGGQWDFGMAKLLGQFGKQKFGGFTTATATTNSDADFTHWVIGTLVPVGAGEIRASYGRAKMDSYTANSVAVPERKQNQWALGYVHNFSKRTAVYATYARLTAKGVGATASQGFTSVASTGGNVNASGWDLGIRHSF